MVETRTLTVPVSVAPLCHFALALARNNNNAQSKPSFPFSEVTYSSLLPLLLLLKVTVP
jgi:hypothetical protein